MKKEADEKEFQVVNDFMRKESEPGLNNGGGLLHHLHLSTTEVVVHDEVDHNEVEVKEFILTNEKSQEIFHEIQESKDNLIKVVNK